MVILVRMLCCGLVGSWTPWVVLRVPGWFVDYGKGSGSLVLYPHLVRGASCCCLYPTTLPSLPGDAAAARRHLLYPPSPPAWRMLRSHRHGTARRPFTTLDTLHLRFPGPAPPLSSYLHAPRVVGSRAGCRSVDGRYGAFVTLPTGVTTHLFCAASPAARRLRAAARDGQHPAPSTTPFYTVP